MDWLAFAGSIIGGLIGGLFTFFGVKITIKHDDKRKHQEELKKAFETRPRFEIVSLERKENSIDEASDLSALMIHIDGFQVNRGRSEFSYDLKAKDYKNLVCFEYRLKNIGLTEIDDVALVCNLYKDTALLDLKDSNVYIDQKFLNYVVYCEKRFIKTNDEIIVRIYFLKSKIIVGTLGASCSLYIRDINGRYWHQPIFVPDKSIESSSLSSYKDFKNYTDIDVAIKCFRGELPW